MKILVLMEHDGTALRSGSGAALGFARALSEDITAFVLGENLEAMAGEASKLAPVLVADHPALAAPVADRWAHVIAEVARAQNAELIVAISTTWAKDIVARAAGLLGGAMASDVIGHKMVDGELRLLGATPPTGRRKLEKQKIQGRTHSASLPAFGDDSKWEISGD